ncbi:unnamed protein product [Prunus armeniaca]|uniref:Uncharacterized protein n=1 Tax=Prunus armeniaca TaxID=36596 RepID=A0A6J5X8P1_PRUAR|nr:unnamed protein product [Prunus armeniaca]CAB4308913.1 unnamed protein product [Prunus armeniaca]
MPFVSLKRPIAMKREIEVIERIQSRISEEGRFHKALLDYKKLYKAGLISELEYLRRKEEEEEKERQSKCQFLDRLFSTCANRVKTPTKLARMTRLL